MTLRRSAGQSSLALAAFPAPGLGMWLQRLMAAYTFLAGDQVLPVVSQSLFSSQTLLSYTSGLAVLSMMTTRTPCQKW